MHCSKMHGIPFGFRLWYGLGPRQTLVDVSQHQLLLINACLNKTYMLLSAGTGA